MKITSQVKDTLREVSSQVYSYASSDTRKMTKARRGSELEGEKTEELASLESVAILVQELFRSK